MVVAQKLGLRLSLVLLLAGATPPDRPGPAAASNPQASGEGWRASCPVGRGRIFLEVGSALPPGQRHQQDTAPEAEACLQPLRREDCRRNRKLFRRSWRQACACLAALLDSGSASRVVSAAKLLADWHCRHERRRLTQYLLKAAEEFTQAPPEPCPEEHSRQLLQLAEAHMRQRGFLPQPVLAALAGRACCREALAMFDTIFARRPELLAAGEQLLRERGDFLIDLRIWQQQCRFQRNLVPRDFLQLMRTGSLEQQVAALVYAPDCFRNQFALGSGTTGAGQARHPLLEVLRLYLSDDRDPAPRAQQWLRLAGDECRVVRFLAAATLQRSSSERLPWLAQLAARESDAWLARVWHSLANGVRTAPPALLRLWLELSPDAYRGTNSSGPNSSR